MTFNKIKELISNNESRTLELKKSTGELKDAMQSACAFLNSEGGTLIFGITPKSLRIVGQEVSDSTQQEIANALSNIEPSVDVRVEYINVPNNPNNKIIVLKFESFVWGNQPYTYKGCPYYRIESTTKVMPRDMFEERLKAAKPNFFAWERQKAESINLDDLNENRLRGAIRLGVERGRMLETTLTENITTILDKLHLLTDGVPNNAAAALFTTKINEYPQFKLRMARFVGTNKNEFIDNVRAEGNIFDLLDAGMSFFFKHLSQSGKIVGFERKEQLEVPAEALREALINAICHRQYEKYNLTIGISIYDDRVEIENPGAFPKQLSVEKIREPHLSYPYNPTIAEVLFKTTFLENWGSGISRIIEKCKECNLPEPEWTSNGGFVIITFRRPINDTNEPINDTNEPINDTNEPINDTNEPINDTNEPINKKQQLIIQLIISDPCITQNEISQKLGLSIITIKRHMKEMKNKQIIKYVGNKKSGHWEIIEN